MYVVFGSCTGRAAYGRTRAARRAAYAPTHTRSRYACAEPPTAICIRPRTRATSIVYGGCPSWALVQFTGRYRMASGRILTLLLYSTVDMEKRMYDAGGGALVGVCRATVANEQVVEAVSMTWLQ